MDNWNHSSDIQLKILQTLLPLITNYPQIHGEPLCEVSLDLLLLFTTVFGDGIQNAEYN